MVSVSPTTVTHNVVTPTIKKTNVGFQTVGKNKNRGKAKSTNGGQVAGHLVKQTVRVSVMLLTVALLLSGLNKVLACSWRNLIVPGKENSKKLHTIMGGGSGSSGLVSMNPGGNTTLYLYLDTISDIPRDAPNPTSKHKASLPWLKTRSILSFTSSVMTFPYMEAVVGFMILMYVFETYLDLRQHAAHKLPNLPKTLEGVISQEKFEKSRAYSIDKSNFHFIHEFVTIVMDSAILLFGVLPWFWKKSGYILESNGLDAENEIYHTLAFLGGVMIWSQGWISYPSPLETEARVRSSLPAKRPEVLGKQPLYLRVGITDLPFSLYSTFVIEERHGFNKQTFWLFIRDMIKGMFLGVIIGPPIVAAIILIVQKGGPYLAIYLWGFMFVLSIVMMTIYPVLIAPLFNKFTPLPEGELRTKIETLASSLEFPLKKLFVVDGSTRSSHSNAYMYGFFKNKRIVLYDTLIQQCKNVEEVVAVIAHELGHWKLNHTMYSFIAVQVLTLLQFGGYTLVKNSKDLFLSFGFDTQPVLIGLILFQHTIIPIQHLVSFGLNLVSRAFEFQADAFAKKLGYSKPLRDGLVKLQEENLSAMNTDPWYSAYHYSHPPLVERLAAIDEADKKAD
ncbi:CAAX prenyl protease 1 [Tanacetum coccineum]